MATRLPIVQASGELQQLQSGDPASPAATAVLRVIDTSCALPSNSTLSTLDSLTVNTGVTFTIPTSSAVLISNVSNEYWTATSRVTGVNYVPVFVSGNPLSDIPGLTYAVAVNSLYEVEVVLKCQSSDTNGLRFALACSASGSTGSVMFLIPLTLGGSSFTYEAAVLGASNGISKMTTATTDGIAVINAVVTTVGNTGNITAQITKMVAGTGTVYIGSIMKIRKLA